MGNKDKGLDRVVIEGVDWHSIFRFFHIFRTFRLAIHPAKLGFALAGVIICYFAGLLMDFFSTSKVVVERPYYSLATPADEIQRFITSNTFADFYTWRDKTIMQNRSLLLSALKEYCNYTDIQAQDAIRSGRALDILFDLLKQRQKSALKLLDNEYTAAKKHIKQRMKEELEKVSDDALEDKIEQEYKTRLEQLKKSYEYLRMSILKSPRIAGLVISLSPQEAADAVFLKESTDRIAQEEKATEIVSKDALRSELMDTLRLADTYDRLYHLKGVGIFKAAVAYGILMFNYAVDSVLSAELFFNENFKSFKETPDTPPGLVKTLGLAFMGLGWFASVHYIYFTIYVLVCVAIWSLAGGSLCRLAALHAGRDEKMPLAEAFEFARKKFLSFFVAPLMPVIFIGLCCLGLIVFGLIGAIPVVGEILAGLGFILPLLMGFVLALVIVGAIGGLGIMYPTIAVEGSDAFDAFSRCYSYVYARPWKTIFYTLITAVYGTLCFIFVKIFVGLVFAATYRVTGFAMNIDPADLAAPLGKLEAMWFSPTLSGPFFGRFYLFPLSTSEAIGSFFIALWVLLFVGFVIAFAISFFFSGYTVIYLLLRKDVDGTDFDEVYIEEEEDEAELEKEIKDVREDKEDREKEDKEKEGKEEKEPAQDENEIEKEKKEAKEEEKEGKEKEDDRRQLYEEDASGLSRADIEDKEAEGKDKENKGGGSQDDEGQVDKDKPSVE